MMDVNHINRNTVKSLLHAAEKGDLRKIDYCLKAIPIDSTDDQSQVALHFAAANGHENIVRHLIKKGAKLECRNWCGWTPIMFAAYYGHANVVLLLVQNNAKVNNCNDRLASPLICAARCGHKAVTEILLDNGAKTNVDVVNKASATSLMAAAQHGHFSIVNLLLQYDVTVDYKNPDTGYTALMLAASNGHLKIVELLIEKGSADTNATNVRNQTAYELSVLRRRDDVMLYLNERTTKTIQRPISTRIPNLIETVKSGKVRKVQEILNSVRNIDVNVKDADGATPLIYASMGGHIDIVRSLLQRDAETDTQDDLHGWTALMQATFRRHVEIVKILLQKGADISIKNNSGLTVFDLATLVGIPEITRLVTPTVPTSTTVQADVLLGASMSTAEQLLNDLLDANWMPSFESLEEAVEYFDQKMTGDKERIRLKAEDALKEALCYYKSGKFDPTSKVVITYKGQPAIDTGADGGLQRNSNYENKGNVKTFFSKVGGKIGISKRNQQSLTRVAVQRSDIVSGSAVGDDMLDREDDTDELKKTSSVLSVIDANKSLSNGSAKARISLLSPQMKLPDDVVAPVLPPYSKLPSFDLPKMPIMGSKLSNSSGSAGEISPYNNSYDSSSIKVLQNTNNTNTRHTGLKRTQMYNNSNIAQHQQEPDSPQSSMTSSGFTSVSQYHGPGIMPEPLFKKKSSSLPQTMEFPNRMLTPWMSPMPSGFAPPTMGGNNQPQYHQVMMNHKTPSPLPLLRLHDMSLQSVRSLNENPENDIDQLLEKLSLQKYRTAFEDEEVDMETLREMDDGDLRDMGIDQTINRDKILSAVSRERSKAPSIRSLQNMPMKMLYHQPVPPSARTGSGSVASAPGHLKLSPLPAFISTTGN